MEPLSAGAYALGTAAGVFALLLTVRGLLARYLTRLARQTRTSLDDGAAAFVRRTHPLVLAVVAVAFAVEVWMPGTTAASVSRGALFLAVLYQVGRWLEQAVHGLAEQRKAEALAESRPADATLWAAFARALQVALWMVLGVIALDNFGVNVGALVAGLGIGGVAVGLAVQNVLGDVFASLSIVLDKPFLVGDHLVVDDVAGTVEHIGWKTTRIRAVTGEQVVLANAGLLARRIRNYARVKERRLVVPFVLAHGAPPARLASVQDVVGAALAGLSGLTVESVHLTRVGGDGYGLEVVCLLAEAGTDAHVAAQHAVLLAVPHALADAGLRLAGAPAGG